MREKNKGITLIALVITIIVLIILAGVSIAMLTGENGILTQVAEATKATEEAEIEERITLAINGSYDNTGKINVDKLKDELIKIPGITKEDESGIIKTDFPNTLPFEFKVDGYDVKITSRYDIEIDVEPLYVGPIGGGTFTDKANKTAYVPEGGEVSSKETEDEISEGLVMELDNSEYVWVEVPREIFISATSNTDYAEIQNDILGYLTDSGNTINPSNYRLKSGTNANAREAGDIELAESWYNGNGLTEEEYVELKENILNGIYENSGFWIGRYEVGNQSDIAVIQYNQTPYTNLTLAESQAKTKDLNDNATLMLGIQWDLTLKFMEEKGLTKDGIDVDYEMVFRNSDSIGNYNGVRANTGATEKATVLNICDLAGNVSEWTLERSTSGYYICTLRGGTANYSGSVIPAGIRTSNTITTAHQDIGFRVVLY